VLADVLGALRAPGPAARRLRAALGHVLTLPRSAVEEVQVALGPEPPATVVPGDAEPRRVARRLATHFPRDPGVVASFLLHAVVLRPGEGLSVGAGVLHSDVAGLGLEVMAASDNVLRAGLTTKTVDVAELLAVVDPEPGPAPVVRPRRTVLADGLTSRRYATPAPEFGLTVLDVDAVVPVPVPATAGPRTLVGLSGVVQVGTRAGRCGVTAGESVLVPDAEGGLRLAGRGTVALVRVPSAVGPADARPVPGPARRDVVARRGRPPGLPPVVRRLRRRRARRPARSRRAARPPRVARRRGPVALPGLPLAAARAGVRRLRPLRRRPGVRHARRPGRRDRRRARHIRVVLDLVLNHTSDEHPWFGTHPERYSWRAPRPGHVGGTPGAEPTNGGAAFGGSAWTWDPGRGAYRLGLFSPWQPDLDWSRADVRSALADVVRFWRARGVDGFRLDVITLVDKPEELRDGPVPPGARYADGIAPCGHGARLTGYLRELRTAAGDALLLGEAPGTTPERAAELTTAGGLDMVLQFEHAELDREPPRWRHRRLDLRDLAAWARRWQAAEAGWPALFLGSHDTGRVATRYGARPPWTARSAAFWAVLLHAHRGTPFVFQGDEIGMTNRPLRGPEDLIDVEGRAVHAEAVAGGADPVAVLAGLGVLGRDHARVPVSWDGSAHGAFTTGTPWSAAHPDAGRRNVAAQRDDPGSVLVLHRDLVALRRTEPALAVGETVVLLPDDPDLHVLVRRHDDDEVLLVASPSDSPVPWPDDPALQGWHDATVLLTSARVPPDDDTGRTAPPPVPGPTSALSPWEARLLRRTRRAPAPGAPSTPDQPRPDASRGRPMGYRDAVSETPALPDLTGLIKAYDVRGTVPDQLDAGVARAIGAAFADVVVLPETRDGARPRVVIGNDMRPSGPELVGAFAEGLAARGVDVVTIGLCSTDGLYFASGTLDVPGAMFTASHNPAEYNGIKLCRAGARPVGQDTGLAQVRDLASQYLGTGIPALAEGAVAGTVTEQDLLVAYAEFLRGLVDLSGIRPLKVVVDAGNGMGGFTAPAVLGTGAGLPALPLDVVPLYFELDGTFPNHEANPLEPANLVDLQKAVVEHGADIGLAFDGDADRCFVVDENGDPVSPSAITALVGLREVAREKAAGRTPTIIHNLITSMVVPDLVTASGAKAVRTRVGHSFIKAQMAESDAVFGGEHSAHYYFRDFFFADTGMLAALHVLAALGGQPHALSALAEQYQPYVASGEINSRVADVPAARARVVEAYVEQQGAGPVTVDELDGLTVSHWDSQPQWWFNLRASNTEPLLRLNVEAADEDVMQKVRDDVLALVRRQEA